SIRVSSAGTRSGWETFSAITRPLQTVWAPSAFAAPATPRVKHAVNKANKRAMSAISLRSPPAGIAIPRSRAQSPAGLCSGTLRSSHWGWRRGQPARLKSESDIAIGPRDFCPACQRPPAPERWRLKRSLPRAIAEPEASQSPAQSRRRSGAVARRFLEQFVRAADARKTLRWTTRARQARVAAVRRVSSPLFSLLQRLFYPAATLRTRPAPCRGVRHRPRLSTFLQMFSYRSFNKFCNFLRA